MSHRRWCFTLFYENDAEVADFDARLRSFKHTRGFVYQAESCPATSRAHLQGYVEFSSAIRGAALSKNLSARSSNRPANGSREQNIEYCTKVESRLSPPVFYNLAPDGGKRGSQGKRNDLHDVGMQILASKDSLSDISCSRPELVLKYAKGLSALLASRDLRRARSDRLDIRVEVYYGDAGTGKTRLARSSMADGRPPYILDPPDKSQLWFDGYEGEEVLILDDFYGWITHHTLLRILDIYQFRCSIKGGHTWAMWTTVRITSNRHPSTWYDNWPWEEDHALRRRIHAIYHFTSSVLGSQAENELAPWDRLRLPWLE